MRPREAARQWRKTAGETKQLKVSTKLINVNTNALSLSLYTYIYNVFVNIYIYIYI